MFKRIVLISLLAVSTSYAKPVKNYHDALSALQEGKKLTFVVNWDSCEVTTPKGVKPNFSSSWTPEGYFISKDGFILARGITEGHPMATYPELGIVNQAYAYTLKQDGSLYVVNRVLDYSTGVEKIDPMIATCQAGKGFKLFAS